MGFGVDRYGVGNPSRIVITCVFFCRRYMYETAFDSSDGSNSDRCVRACVYAGGRTTDKVRGGTRCAVVAVGAPQRQQQ